MFRDEICSWLSQLIELIDYSSFSLLPEKPLEEGIVVCHRNLDC